MKHILGILFLALTFTAQSAPKPASSDIPLAICGDKHPEYEYALCAASTCTKTGNIIKDNAGTKYQEVSCTCPILKGKAIAWPNGGGTNMGSSCAAKKGEVWSLFAPHLVYPQQASNFKKHPRSAQKVTVQKCKAALDHQSSNCFSFSCKRTGFVNGTPVADCRCPIGQIKDKSKEDFLTEAGQGDPHACAENPVAAPDPATKEKMTKFYKGKK